MLYVVLCCMFLCVVCCFVLYVVLCCMFLCVVCCCVLLNVVCCFVLYVVECCTLLFVVVCCMLSVVLYVYYCLFLNVVGILNTNVLFFFYSRQVMSHFISINNNFILKNNYKF